MGNVRNDARKIAIIFEDLVLFQDFFRKIVDMKKDYPR